MGPQQHVIQSDPHANSIRSKVQMHSCSGLLLWGNRGENIKFSLVIGWGVMGWGGGIWCHAGGLMHLFLIEEASGINLFDLGQQTTTLDFTQKIFLTNLVIRHVNQVVRFKDVQKIIYFQNLVVVVAWPSSWPNGPKQGCPILFLEVHCPAKLSPNPKWQHLN